MQDHQVAEVTSHKHLGGHLSNDCTWHNRIGSMKGKAWVRLNMMGTFKYELNRRPLEIIYTSFIQPTHEYGGVVWSNCYQQEQQELRTKCSHKIMIFSGKYYRPNLYHCRSTENAQHFLNCSCYTDIRRNLINYLSQICTVHSKF